MWKTSNYCYEILRKEVNRSQILNGGASMAFFRKTWKPLDYPFGLGNIKCSIKFVDHWGYLLLLPIHFLIGSVPSDIINWYAHKYDCCNFEGNKTAQNLLHFDFPMLGEGYQIIITNLTEGLTSTRI